MFSHTEQPADAFIQSLLIVTLLTQKYPALNLRSRASKVAECTDILFLDSLNDVKTAKEDPINEKPLHYLRLCNASITKESHEKMAQWCYSVATLKNSELNNIITGLQQLPDFAPKRTGILKAPR